MSEEKNEGFQPKTEEEIRTEVIADLRGDEEEFDEEANADLITRVSSRRLKDEEFKASVHSQKIERTEKAKKLEEELAALKGSSNTTLDENKLREKLREIREEEKIEEMEYSDEIKGKIKTLAKLNGISVKKAAEDDYIKTLIKAEEDEKLSSDAALNSSNKGRAKKNLVNKNPNDFDLTTEEGQAEWEEFKKQKGFE